MDNRNRFNTRWLVSAILGISLLAVGCNDTNPSASSSGGDASVSIAYYVGSSNFSAASIYVNGGFFVSVSKNSTRSIKVTSGDDLRAEYVNYAIYPYSGIDQFRTITASNKLSWKIP